MTRKEYAEYKNISAPMVTKHDQAGRLIFNDDGLIDVRKSDALIETNKDTRGGDRSSGTQNEKVSYLAAKTKEANARAVKAELEAQEMAGRVAYTEDIAKTAFELAREAREKLFSIPDRLSAQLAAESNAAKVHELLTSELTHIANELSDQ